MRNIWFGVEIGFETQLAQLRLDLVLHAHPSGCAVGGNVVLKPDWYQSRGATVQAFELRQNSVLCGCACTSRQGAVLTHRKYDFSSHPFWVV